jgi:hypothetical protein
MGNGSGGNYMLDGRLISGATPADGDVLSWVTADRCWEPRTVSTILPTVVNQDYYIDAVTGLDTNSGLTKTAPLATIAGFFAKYGSSVPIASRRRVHLAGTGGADPWVTPATAQIHGVDEINFGISAPIGNHTVFRGPTNMLLGTPATGPATAALDAVPVIIVDEAEIPPALSPNPAGQRSALQFTVAAPNWTPHDFGVYGQGYKVRITRAGAKVIFECPIADNSADTIIVDTLGLLAIVLATDTVEVVYPAATLRGSTDYGGGVHYLAINGQGAPVIASAALTSASPGHNFERLILENTFVFGTGITFDRCCIIPGVGPLGFVCTGDCHFTNSMAVQTPVSYRMGGSTHTLAPAVSNTPRPDALLDPINQVICVEAMFNELVIGDGGEPGFFTADNNLSVYGSGAEGIGVGAGGRFDQSATCAYLGGDSNTSWGINCQDGSQARVQAIGGGGTATEIAGAGNPLCVDDHAGVAYGAGVGAFGEVAGFNGLYHNVSLAAGVTTGMMSVIHT